VQIPENFYEPIINYIDGLVIVIYIAEDSLQTIAIELLIEDLLISMAVTDAVKNNLL
jgi:hypothetical protein